MALAQKQDNLEAVNSQKLGISPLEFYVKHKLTQLELADLLGVAPMTAHQMIHQSKKPTYYKYWLACGHLDHLIETGKLKLIRNHV